MRAQRRDCAVVTRQFGLAQSHVYLVVADLMQQNRLASAAATQAGNEMMDALRNVLRMGRWQRVQTGSVSSFRIRAMNSSAIYGALERLAGSKPIHVSAQVIVLDREARIDRPA